MHIDGQQPDLVFRQATLPGRHLAHHAAVNHLLHHLQPRRVVFRRRHLGHAPDIVGEIGRTLGLHARAFGGVTVVAAAGLALEDLLAAGGQAAIHFVTGQAQHITGHGIQLLVIEGVTECRHIAHPAMGKGVFDVFYATTPQPVVVHQIGEQPRHAGATGTMAGGAVVTEKTAAHGTREGQHFLVGEDFLVAGRSHLLHVFAGTHRMLAFLHVAQQQGAGVPVRGHLFSRVIGEGDRVHHTLGVAGGNGPGRVQHPVDQGKHHRGVEGPHPPVGQRVVEFLQITIPGMAGGLNRALFLRTLLL